MTIATAKPGHRRQGSDGPLPALGAPTSTVTLDGRLLEAQECQQRGRQQKEDEGRAQTRAPTKAAVARPPPLGRVTEKIPLTPPRVSGVSLAPLPNLDHYSAPDKQQLQLNAKIMQRRPSMTYVNLGGKAPPPPAGVANCNAAPAAPACPQQQQLIAEGRSIQRNVSFDPWVAAYIDIHGGDDESICATPPRISMQALARCEAAASGALGLLTPCPLTPSILTVCAQPGVDDHFAVNPSVELIDMRTCLSPKLPPM